GTTSATEKSVATDSAARDRVRIPRILTCVAGVASRRKRTCWTHVRDAQIRSPHPPLELALNFAADHAISALAAAVAALPATGQRQFDLCAWALEVDPGRDQRQPFLGGFPDQPLDLLAMQEQLARTLGVMGVAGRELIRGDVQLAQPDLAVVDD